MLKIIDAENRPRRADRIEINDAVAIESEVDSSGPWAQAVVQRPRRKACAATTTPLATPAFPRACHRPG